LRVEISLDDGGLAFLNRLVGVRQAP